MYRLHVIKASNDQYYMSRGFLSRNKGSLCHSPLMGLLPLYIREVGLYCFLKTFCSDFILSHGSLSLVAYDPRRHQGMTLRRQRSRHPRASSPQTGEDEGYRVSLHQVRTSSRHDTSHRAHACVELSFLSFLSL